MIEYKEISVGYQYSIEQKHRNHAAMGPKGDDSNDFGGNDEKIARAFEKRTLPLRNKLKFDDQVVFLDKDDNVVNGVVTYGGKDVNPKTHIAVNTTSGIIVVPREHLRMPKGGFRTRGE